MKQVSGRFIADGSAINVDIGFVPDHVKLIQGLEETNMDIYEYFLDLEDNSQSGQYGILLTGSTGVVTKLDGTNNKIAKYEGTADVKALVPAADADGETAASVAEYATGTTYSARSTTAVGSVVWPTTRNGFVYECTTASGGAAGTEPTWGTTPGGSTTAGSGDVWICRREHLVRQKSAGFTIGSDVSVDSDEWIYIATQFDKVVNHGDAAEKDPI